LLLLERLDHGVLAAHLADPAVGLDGHAYSGLGKRPRVRMTCTSSGSSSSFMASSSARTEPGSITRRRPFAMPAPARENQAAAPTCAQERMRNNSPKPSSRLSNSGASASGVTSRGLMPVPP